MSRSSLPKRSGAVFGLAGAVALAFMAPPAALASPASEPDPNPTTYAPGTEQTIEVPAGVCAVNVTIAGSFGGLTVTPGDVDDDNPGEDTEVRGKNGAGAQINALLNVEAGDELDLVVGTAGGSFWGGVPGGGNGGNGGHPGGGGGGYSTISVGGDLLLLAAGGGGTGGGHSADHGFGGDAGAGQSGHDAISITGGIVYPGEMGSAGQDRGLTADPVTTPGAGSGGSDSGGSAGTNPGLAGVDGTGLDGEAGISLQGGNGGREVTGSGGNDTGGAGGGGYFGGGGGAATDGDVQPSPNPNGDFFGGGGGGGGSSFVSDSALLSGVSLAKNRVSEEEAEETGLAEGAARPGYATFEWIMCDYELDAVKSVLGAVDEAGTDGTLIRTTPVFEDGDIVRYSVTVTNTGADNMGVGNTVTLVDDLAAGGTVVSVSGLNTVDPAVDGTIPNVGGNGVIEAFDEVDLSDDPDNPRIRERGLDAGESVTIVYDVVVQGDGAVTNTVSVEDPNGIKTSEATVDPADPSLSLVKSANAERATTVGQKITYSFVVKNTGNIELRDIKVEEGSFSGKGDLPDPTCPTTELAPGASTTCTSVYTVVAGDLTGANLTNTATAVGQTPGGVEVVSPVADAKIVTVKPEPLQNTGGQSMLGYSGLAALLLALGGAAIAANVVRKRRVES